MKHMLAGAIMSSVVVVGTAAVGAAVRGPLADRSLTRDLGVGAVVVGSLAAVQWAMKELEAS